MCCLKLANDFSALPQLCLAIKDGPEHIRRFWDTLSKLQVRPGRVQILEPFDWFKGYKIACSCLHLEDPSILGKELLLVATVCKRGKKETIRVIRVKQLVLKKSFLYLNKEIDIHSVVFCLFWSTRVKILPIQHLCYFKNWYLCESQKLGCWDIRKSEHQHFWPTNVYHNLKWKCLEIYYKLWPNIGYSCNG